MRALHDTTVITAPDNRSDYHDLPPGAWFTSSEMSLDPELMYFAEEDLEHCREYSRPRCWAPERRDSKGDYGPQSDDNDRNNEFDDDANPFLDHDDRS